ncbi:Uma2 family endonuclease [Sorangium sp. So ce1128]
MGTQGEGRAAPREGLSRLAARSCALGMTGPTIGVRGRKVSCGTGRAGDGGGALRSRGRSPSARAARGGARWRKPGSYGTVEAQLQEHEVHRPDVMGWRRDRLPELPDKTPILVRPDWVCEVLSPSNTRNDVVKNQRTYHRCQVPHSWIVDPMNEVLTVHRWMQDGYLIVLTAERGERVKAEPFDAIAWSVGVLFGDDPDEEQRGCSARRRFHRGPQRVLVRDDPAFLSRSIRCPLAPRTRP